MNNINNAFKINTFHCLKTHMIICEDVFENPLHVREYALQKYNHCIKKSYGHICSYGIMSTDIAQLYSKLLKMNIYIKNVQFLFIHKMLRSYPHKDDHSIHQSVINAIRMSNSIDVSTGLHIASVIYLNPTVNEFNYTQFFENCDKYKENLLNVTSFVGNRFNKIVLYDGSICHAPGSGFGNDVDPETMRLVTSYFIYAYFAQHSEQSY